jgi:catalase
MEPVEAIDRINGAYGSHARSRALHARGGFFTGTFTPTAEAAQLCRAAVYQGPPVPVRVRWSNAGGNPKVGDDKPDIRGMAVSWRLPDGSAVDLLGQTAPRFVTRTPEAFVDFVEAARTPYRLPLFLLRHRGATAALVANARAKALAVHRSFAELSYYTIHAYRWTAPDSTERWVRHVFRPLPGSAPTETFDGPDALQQEVVARLPVRFSLEVTVAAEADDPHDAMAVWKGDRTFDAGTIVVTGPDGSSEQDGGIVVFDPTRVIDGIGLSDDPILLYRPAAYSESAARRST